MARIPTVDHAGATPEQAGLLADIERRFGNATNMKRTLIHSPTALEALVTWYPLHAEVGTFLTEREVRLFCHAISARTECLLCTTFFRRELLDAGENPEDFDPTPAEADVIAFGARIGSGGSGVPDALFHRVAARFDHAQLVTLVAFGALMVATNVVNNALNVDLDPELLPYRAAADTATRASAASMDAVGPRE